MSSHYTIFFFGGILVGCIKSRSRFVLIFAQNSRVHMHVQFLVDTYHSSKLIQFWLLVCPFLFFSQVQLSIYRASKNYWDYATRVCRKWIQSVSLLLSPRISIVLKSYGKNTNKNLSWRPTFGDLCVQKKFVLLIILGIRNWTYSKISKYIIATEEYYVDIIDTVIW